jgi:hypothetical protein
VRSAFSNQRHVDHDACTYRSPSSCGDSSSRSFRPTPGCTATRTAPWAASNPGAPPGRLADPGRRPKTRTARTTSLRKAVARLCQGRRGEPSPPWFEKWPLKPLRASLIARAAAARATRRRSRSLLDHPGGLARRRRVYLALQHRSKAPEWWGIRRMERVSKLGIPGTSLPGREMGLTDRVRGVKCRDSCGERDGGVRVSSFRR